MKSARRIAAALLLFLLAVVPSRAQWTGGASFLGGYGWGRDLSQEDLTLYHYLLQGEGSLKYTDSLVRWETVLGVSYEPNSSSAIRAEIASEEDEESKIQSLLRYNRTVPVNTTLRSNVLWTPAPGIRREAWISYGFSSTIGDNKEQEAGDEVSVYRNSLHRHTMQTGVRWSRLLASGHRVLQGEILSNYSRREEVTHWKIVNGYGGSEKSSREYRIMPKSNDVNISACLHLADTVLNGKAKLVLDPGVRLSGSIRLDNNTADTLDGSSGQDIWSEYLRLRDDFDYKVLQAEPYLALFFMKGPFGISADYGLQLFTRVLKDEDNQKRVDRLKPYAVGSGSVFWQPSSHHRLTLGNTLSVTYPDFTQICWYDRTGSYSNQIFRGNINLKSSLSRQYLLSWRMDYGKFQVTTEAAFRHVTDEIEQTFYSDVINWRVYKIFTWINAADCNGWKISQELGWNGNVFKANVGADVNRVHRLWKEREEIVTDYDWRLKADATLAFGKGWSLGADFNYTSRIRTLFSRISPYYKVNAWIQKDFKKFTIYLQGRDLVDNIVKTEHYSVDRTASWKETVRNNNRLIVLGLLWTF